MSVEALAVTRIVEDGAAALRKLYAGGITYRDFPVYEEEFRWIEKRLGNKKSMNRRVFRERFPDFEWMPSSTSVDDLAQELKEERAFEAMNDLLSELADNLEKDNAIDLAMRARDKLGLVSRSFLPMSDFDLDDWQVAMEHMRQGIILRKQGKSLAIPTGFRHLDHHLEGWLPGQMTQILGRSGEGKSMVMIFFGWIAKKHGYNVAIFTPEHSLHEVRCRYHTLASADKDVQRDVGLQRSFRNRALMRFQDFNLKSYQRFIQHLRDMPGRFHLLSGTSRPEQMTVGYVEDRIVEYELDLVLVDPLYLLKPVRMSQQGNEYQEEAWTAQAIHELSERYNIPIIFSSQSHMDKKEDAPHKSDTFGAKGKVHIADYVIGVMHLSEDNVMKFRSSKSRFGGSFRFDMGFFANTGKWADLTPLKGSYYNGEEDVEDEEMRRMIEEAVRPQEEAVDAG